MFESLEVDHFVPIRISRWGDPDKYLVAGWFGWYTVTRHTTPLADGSIREDWVIDNNN